MLVINKNTKRVFHFFLFCGIVLYMKKTNYKKFIESLTNEQLNDEKNKVQKLLSVMPLKKLIDLNTEEQITKNVLIDIDLQKRLFYRNQFVALAKRISEITQHFRWNYAQTWLNLFALFYKDDAGETTFDIKFITLSNHKSGFINSLNASSFKAFNQYLKHYLQYIQDNRHFFEKQNQQDIEKMKYFKNVITIEPDYRLRKTAAHYANKKIRESGFFATDVCFEECFDEKWKNYFIALKKYNSINNEQKNRLTKTKSTQLELEF